MCDVCWKTPCDPRCPNAPEPKKFGKCNECGYDIYEGDDYYEINGETYCEACICSFLRIAEVD